jgi:hypothetical protein
MIMDQETTGRGGSWIRTLGAALFVRSKRSVALTEFGREWLAHVRPAHVAGQVGHAQAAVGRRRARASGGRGGGVAAVHAPAATPGASAEPGVLGLAEYLERNRNLACVVPDLHRTPPPGVFAGFAMGPHRAMLDLEDSLHAGFPGQLSLHTIRSPRYLNWMCEIAPVGVTKWSGVMSLAREWGIDAAEICAVGDDVNDLPMIRGAALGIAMGNAQPEVLAAADRIVGRQDDDGLVDVAELLVGPG